MDRFQDQVIFEGTTEFLQIPIRRPTKFVGTTPNIFGNEYWKADNNGTITNFIKGAEGQTLRILGDGLTTVSHNTNIKTATAANELLNANVVYKFTLFDGIWYEDITGTGGGGGGGEANTASNLGTGVGIFAGKVGVDLRFKSLIAGSNVTITSTGTDITINAATSGVPVPLTVSGSVAGKIAFFENTDTVNGFGVRIQNDGPIANYALKISNAAGTGMFTAYSRTVLHLGPEGSTQINNILSGTSTNAFLSLEAITGTDGQAGIILKAASSNVVSMLYQTGGDGGMRLSWNYSEPYVAGNSYGNVNYPQIQTSWETDGAFGLNYNKPSVTAPSTYETGGKSLKIFGGGYPGGAGGVRTKYTTFTVGQIYRGMNFSVTNDANPSDYVERFRIEPYRDSAASGVNNNPIYMYVNGAMRQVLSFNDGAGHNVLYY